MKILTITNLFPNSSEPTRGIFNFQQFKALREQGAEIKVIAPIPWHHFSKLPMCESIDGFDVYHQRYFMIPGIGRSLYGFFFYLSLIGKIKRIYKEFKFNIIFATWAYPDGFASFLIARALKKPIVIKVHGTDINIYSKYLLRRKMISWTLRNSNKVIAVSNALKEQIVKIGVPEEKITVIPNGVDADLFKPMNQQECRRKLGLPLDKKIILYAGNFAQVKGVDILVSAFGALKHSCDNALLLLVGDGPLDKTLREKVKGLGVESQVVFAGRIPHSAIRHYMNACDVFCLPSRAEGCPNVVLEAFASGKPVVAASVGGVPELITSEELGLLVEPDNYKKLADVLSVALTRIWDSQVISKNALLYSWYKNVGQLKKELDVAVLSYNFNKISWRSKIKNKLMLILPSKFILVRGKTKLKKIALTFDDGPNALHTDKILDILKKEQIKATFFLVGNQVQTNKQIAKRIIAEGHSVGMHSLEHKNWKNIPFIRKQKDHVEMLRMFRDDLGVNSKLFRPPKGIMGVMDSLFCFMHKLNIVLWSIDSGDSKNASSEAITALIKNIKFKPGDIILLHDDNFNTVNVLPFIINMAKEEGYKFVVIEEFLR